MFSCFVCKKHHKTCSNLCKHLKFFHGLYPAKNLRLKCGELGCVSSFCTYSGFRKHLNTVHSCQVSGQSEFYQGITPSHSAEDVSVDQPTTSASLLQVPPNVAQNSLVEMCGSIVAQLQASGQPENTVQTIVNSMEEVVNDVHMQAREAAFQTFTPEDKNSDTYKKVELSLSQLNNPFTPFNTEKKREKYYAKKWEIVDPKEFVLGVRLDTRRSRKTGVYSQIPVTDKYMYVPILGTLN